MVAGADSIDDMAMLRHGGMGRVFAKASKPSTLGSFLRAFTFGHVRQLDAVASRFLTGLSVQAPMVVSSPGTAERVMLEIDDTIIEVHGYPRQGSGYGYSGVRGLNALLAVVSTTQSAPVIVAQRLRRGSCGSPRGAARPVADALKTLSHLTVDNTVRPLVRADFAFYGSPPSGPRSRAAPMSRSPGGSWSAGSQTSTRAPRMVRRRCSTPGASTRSSPPPTTTWLTRWPRIIPSAATRSSSKSTPT